MTTLAQRLESVDDYFARAEQELTLPLKDAELGRDYVQAGRGQLQALVDHLRTLPHGVEIDGSDGLVAAAIRTLVAWDEVETTRCSRHQFGRAPDCPECKLLERSAGSTFRHMRELAYQLRTSMVLA